MLDETQSLAIGLILKLVLVGLTVTIWSVVPFNLLPSL